MTQRNYLFNLCGRNPSSVIIGSLGTISYDLKEIKHDHKLLIKGAMGSAIGCGLGYALSAPDEDIIVVIGEGALLMHLGSLSTVLAHKPPNLRIIVINNGCYDSCGGQKNNFKYIKDYLTDIVEVVDL